jgi:hypothetical protein
MFFSLIIEVHVFLSFCTLAVKFMSRRAFYLSLIAALSKDFNTSMVGVENFNVNVEKNNKLITI